MIQNNVKEFYTSNCYPNPALYNIKYQTSIIGPTFKHQELDILIVGCGTYEAPATAYNNPKSRIVGVDFSETSIAVAKSISRHYKLKNIKLHTCDFLEFQTDTRFDLVLAVGVLHHIPDVNKALQMIKAHIKDTGHLIGMVYNDEGRKEVPELVKHIRDYELDIPTAKEFLREKHPNWTYGFEEVYDFKDTWYHPYFKQYTKNSLKELLDQYFPGVQVVENYPYQTKVFFATNNLRLKVGEEK
jgi:SAM-dependent methyltransferase